MKTLLSVMLMTSVAATGLNAAGPAPVYELATCTALPGRLPDVIGLGPLARALFEKHGMEPVGFFVPVEQKDGDRLLYILKHSGREAADASWKSFRADPEWIATRDAIGWPEKIISALESTFLSATDYSPATIPAPAPGQVYELRTYTCNEGKLVALDARFRKHTMALFERHGMTNILYTHPTDADQGAGRTLVYLLAHGSEAAAKKSWDAFRQDPEWIQVREASEANGRILIDGGVKSVLLTPLDFPPLR